MKTPSIFARRIEQAAALSPFAATAWLAFSPLPAHAALTDIAPAPLANSASAVVKPNILMILDDSGSMDSAFMPDYVTSNYCKFAANSPGTLDNCQYGDPPYNGAAFNGLAYNPSVTYTPAINADTTSKTNYNTAALWAAVPNDAYGIQFTGNIDLTQNYPDFVWCSGSPSSTDRTPPYLSGVCKLPLALGTGVQTWTYPDGTFDSRQSINNGSSPLIKAPFYYTIASVQWCSSKDSLGFGSTSCQAKKTSTFKYPKYNSISRTDIVTNEVTTPYVTTSVNQQICTGNSPSGCGCTGSNKRRVTTTTTTTRTIVTRGARVISDVTAAPVVGTPVFSGTCSSSNPSIQSPNPDVTANVAGTQTTTTLTYPKVASRSDCTGTVGAAGCSFTEEMTNFANWYTYYRTRMQMMKTASGLAFKTLNQNYRVGFLTINPMSGSSVSSSKFLAIAPFEGAQRTSWYAKFYAQNPGPSTPLREALARAGRYYAGKGVTDTASSSGINRAMNDDPVQYSCQQNFAILSTDGLWNTGSETVGPVAMDSTTLVGNTDSSATVAPRPLLDGSNEKTVTNDTATTTTQALCTGNAAVLGTTCGCPANLKRIIEQTVVSTDSKTFVGGVQQGGTTNTTNTTYAGILPTSGCDAKQVGTQTPQTSVQTIWCKRGSNSPVTFGDGAIVTCSANLPADPAVTGGKCSSGTGVVIRQTKNQDRFTVSYDSGSPVTSTTVNSVLYEYSTNGTSWSSSFPGSCTGTQPSGSNTGPTVTNGAVVVVNTGSTVTTAGFTITGGGPISSTASTSTTSSGTSNTLADVAQYYYITDLRGGTDSFGNATGPSTSPSTTPSPGGDVSENNVKGQTSGDPQNDSSITQHMTTFTVGLGVDGTLTYASDYKENPTGDFLLIKNGGANWPTPVADTDTAVDDLWHAGVNGRGKYLSARDPSQLTSGLSEALTSVNAVVGAAAAAATSNLEPVAGDNFAYIASYETVRWNGEVEARTIDLNTGAVSTTTQWSAQSQLDTLANATSPGGDNRKIYRLKSGETDAGTGSDLQNFTYANLDATTEKIYFKPPHISGGSGAAFPALTQWSSLDPTTQQSIAQQTNMVNFIRGDGSFENNTANTATNRVFRDRAHVLGDIVNAQPVFVKATSLGYTDTDYAAFKACLNNGGAGCATITGTTTARPATVYISANDGMLHALNGDTGAERWAFIPNILMPKLYRLTDSDYKTAINHQWMVDGSPTVGDIFDGTKWRTILVGGLNGGERGFYALDVTDPTKPKGLWELKTRSTSCTFAVNDTTDCDLGFSYGNPIITKLGDGTWVVMLPSGYNNVNPGDGKGYLYVVKPTTGQIQKKIALCSTTPQAPSICPGDTTTPMGFARINNWVDDSSVNNTTLRIYGGDLLGNIWRINADTGVAYVVANANDGAATPVGQPITTRPELGQVTGSGGTADMIYIGTGKYLGTGDTSTTQKQSVYAIKDSTNGTAPVTPIDLRGTSVKSQTLADTTDATGAAVRTVTNTPVSVTTAGVDGWRVDLPVSGERVNVDIKLQLGTLIVGSNVPANNACNAGGFSFLNFFDYRTGSYIPSSGSNIAGQRVGNSLLVGINVVRLPNNKTVAIATTSDNQHPTLYPPFQSPNPVGRRVGWRELNE